MTRKREAVTLSCTPAEKESLALKALKYGCTLGDRPNISAFIKAIANDEIPLGESSPEFRLKARIKRLEAELEEEKAKSS